MNKLESVEVFINEISKLIPENLPQFRKELEENLRTAAEASFKRINLVTREEFDIQTEVLKKTRGVVDELEEKIRQLEEKLPPNNQEGRL